MGGFKNHENKKAFNPDTGEHFLMQLPAPEAVRQTILELEYPSDESGLLMLQIHFMHETGLKRESI